MLLAEAVHGDLGKHVLNMLWRELLQDVGLDHGGGDAIDEDVRRGQFLAE